MEFCGGLRMRRMDRIVATLARGFQTLLAASATVLLTMALGSCASLTAPPRTPIDRTISPERPKRPPSIGHNGVMTILTSAADRDPEGLLRTTLPSIRYGIEWLLWAGAAEEIGRADFFHVHILYPHARLIGYRNQVDLRINLWLLFHTRERPHQLRETWIDDLQRIDEPELRAWVESIHRTDFDYRDFFYGSGRIHRREPLPDSKLDHLTRVWQTHNPAVAGLESLRARIVYVQGSSQPGYHEAADLLFSRRSFLMPLGSSPPALAPLHPSGYVTLATVYFDRSPSRTDPRAAAAVVQSYWGYDFVLVSEVSTRLLMEDG